MNKLQTLLFSIIVALVVAGIVFAWTNPTGNPTTGGGALYYSGGNVGIGTASPNAKLDVQGGHIKGSYYCCGHTNTDGTGWVPYGSSNAIYIDVNTASCNFPTTPMYFTSIGGDGGHFEAVGVTSIYSPTATGFRVYIQGIWGIDWSSAMADTNNWHIQWCGLKQKIAGLDTGSY